MGKFDSKPKEEQSVSSEHIAWVTKAVRSFYERDYPAPDEVIVYPKSIQALEEHRYLAHIKIMVNYCGLRQHKVKMTFVINSYGRLLPDSIEYQ